MAKDSIMRFPEIDFLRGIAVIMMIAYNWLFALDYLGIYRTTVASGEFWFYFARATAAAFILLAGMALSLSYSRASQQKKGGPASKYLLRGLKIFLWGLIITAVTWIFLRGAFVRFGILHLIGLSIILAYPFLGMKYSNLFAGIAIIGAGIYLHKFTFSFSWLLWLGFVPQNFSSVDYFPVFPWFGVLLIGVFLGNALYPGYKRKFNLPDLSGFHAVQALSFLGRNSLFIYLIHQPVLIAVLYALGFNISF